MLFSNQNIVYGEVGLYVLWLVCNNFEKYSMTMLDK